MNYRGLVTSVNTVLWTFEMDNKILVHMGHLATQNTKQMLPEVGEQVLLYNVHYKPCIYNQLEKMFLCENSTILCDYYKSYVREGNLLNLIHECNLGVSDLLEIDYNIAAVDRFLTALTRHSTEEIILDVLQCIAHSNHKRTENVHKCLNKNIPVFTLKTISSCRYIDLQSNNEGGKGPPWSFGTHSKFHKCDILVGLLKVNKRHGVVCICDAKYSMACLITSKNKHLSSDGILNKFVLITKYRVFTELYRDPSAFNLEYILFDVEDALVLDLKSQTTCSQEMLFKELPCDFPYVYDFKFQLIEKATISIVNESTIECWLEVLVTKNSYSYYAYLGLNAYQVQVIPFLREGETYHIYHSEKLKDWKHFELLRLKSHKILQKFTEKTVAFVPYNSTNCEAEIGNSVLNVVQAIEKIKETNNCISFQGLLSIKKFTPSLSSRTQSSSKYCGFGTPGTNTHTLTFTDDARECKLLLYLNNWENLQVPLGLIVDMRICVRNAMPQKNKYLKACPMTRFEILSYEPLVFFDTINLNNDLAHGCDKYSFLGLGNLIPYNVLIWASVLQIHVRSLKIIYKCETCNETLRASDNCSCGHTERKLDITITLFVYDEMGQALVISKSTDLLRLLIGLELKQWKIWCCAFERVGEYVHEFGETVLIPHKPNAFGQALAASIKLVNAMRNLDLELMCRKMESKAEDNEGMSVWFCVSARKKEL